MPPTRLRRVGLSAGGLNALDVASGSDIVLSRRRLERMSALLAPTLDSLSAADFYAVGLAAQLSPDAISISWLEVLCKEKFPELAAAVRTFALNELETNLSIDEETLHQDHPERAARRVSLGQLENTEGAFQAAFEHFTAALTALERHEGDKHWRSVALEVSPPPSPS